MRSMFTRTAARMLVLATFATLAGAGCANPKYIATSTGGPDDIKFLFVDASGDQGVIKCARAADGELSNCRRMRIVLKD